MKGKLVEESLSLFEKKGFAETSIQEIVEACGVTKGTFYYYFDSKAKLLFDIQSTYIEDVLERQEGIKWSPMTNQEKLKEMVALLIEKIKTDGSSANIFFREMRHLPEDDLRYILKKRDAIRINLEEVIRKGTESGEFKADLNVPFVTFAVLGMCNWSYSWFDPHGKEGEVTLISTYVDLLLNGILPR